MININVNYINLSQILTKLHIIPLLFQNYYRTFLMSNIYYKNLSSNLFFINKVSFLNNIYIYFKSKFSNVFLLQIKLQFYIKKTLTQLSSLSYQKYKHRHILRKKVNIIYIYILMKDTKRVALQNALFRLLLLVFQQKKKKEFSTI